MKLSGQRVLVTGAGGAFGSATCAAIRADGGLVAGIDIATQAGDSELTACDITDSAQVSQAVDAAATRLGGFDAVVHYAGIGLPVDAGAPPDAAVHRTLDVNLLGAWRVTAAALPALLAARGRLVFVASELAYATLPFTAAYAVSKRGLTAYADAVRLEYGSHLGVTTVYPGYVRTPIHADSNAVGLSMEGLVRRERVADVVATVLRTLRARRALRDVATTRAGALELWAARHLPGRTEAVVRWRLRHHAAAGRFTAPLARGLAERYAAPAVPEGEPPQ